MRAPRKDLSLLNGGNFQTGFFFQFCDAAEEVRILSQMGEFN
jgi:hypothetical protein